MKSSELASMTYLSLMMLGWSSFLRHLISLSTLHSSMVLYFCFSIFLMATIWLFGSTALKTMPKEPSPMDLTILYFYIVYETI